MSTDTTLAPCPFCGGEPSIVERPDNIDGTEFFCAMACYCGGYSARAHQMAVRKTPELAKANAIAAWNRRAATSGEAVAWMHEEDPRRVISHAQREAARRDGGASWTSVRAYTVPLVRRS